MALYSDEELKKVLADHDTQVATIKHEQGLEEDHVHEGRIFEYSQNHTPKADMSYFREVYRSPEFTRVMNEFFDVTDSNTRKILLAVNEADQDKIMVNLTSKLYDAIMDKVDDIDFGEIPDTKGDITKLSNYEKIVDCLNIMKELLKEYKQPTDPVDVVQIAINNILERKELFAKAFRYKVELPMVLYNGVVLGIVTATSYLISTTIAFIKTPTNDTFEMTLDRQAMTKTKQHMVFTTLKKFNDACRSGEVDKACEYIIRNNVKNLTGLSMGVIAGGIAVVALIFSIIPIIRELIFLGYYTRVRTSEYFDAQATLLQLNASNIESNKTLDKEQKTKILAKQNGIANAFKKISNALAIKVKTAEVEATKDIVSSNKKYKADEVVDSVPDSAGSVLF